MIFSSNRVSDPFQSYMLRPLTKLAFSPSFLPQGWEFFNRPAPETFPLVLQCPPLRTRTASAEHKNLLKPAGSDLSTLTSFLSEHLEFQFHP